MKKLLVLVGAVLVAAVTNAQTTNSHNPFIELGQGLAALGTSTNWGFVGYGTQGSSKTVITNGKKTTSRAYGGGLLGIYSLSDFIGVGGGVDELTGLKTKGQATIINATIQAQLPLKPLSLFWTNGFAENFTLTPGLYSSLGTPIGSTISQSAVAHEGEFVNVDIYNFGTWTIGAGYALIQRQNAEEYSGNYKNYFITLHHPF